MPREQFEAALAAPEKPTTGGIIAAAFPREPMTAYPVGGAGFKITTADAFLIASAIV